MLEVFKQGQQSMWPAITNLNFRLAKCIGLPNLMNKGSEFQRALVICPRPYRQNLNPI